jgi:homocysteine S-methyltransferase
MNNEVPGASVPEEIMARMRKTTSKEEGFAEGIQIARETYQHIKPAVGGVQLAAPLGRIDAVFQILS